MIQHRHKRLMVTAMLASLLVGFLPVGPAGAVTSRQVIRAIRRGVTYLLSKEKPRHLWESYDLGMNQFTRGGETALVTEALIDVSSSLHLRRLSIFDPAMARAIKYVAAMRTQSTYAASFQANALALLPNYRKPAYFKALEWDSRYLNNAMHRDGGYTYRWTPGLNPPHQRSPGHWDNSNTQYGVLGQWAAAHAGVHLPQRYWFTAARHWHATQYLNGTWGYWGFRGRPHGRPSRPETMTPAGIASLLIADEYLKARAPGVDQKDMSVVRAMRWIDKHINPKAKDLYELYGYERVGLATGLQYFGHVNWYDAFASDLVHRQNKNGSWYPMFRALRWNERSGDSGTGPYREPVIGTAYALLILDRGLNPVVFNKLQYSSGYFGTWNRRPRDAANVTSWMTRAFDAPLNWQVVNIDTPSRTWLDSPILLITGSHPVNFTKMQIARLRHYVHAGGMVFCNCNDYSAAFRQSMMKLGEEVCGREYPARKLGPKNMLYKMQSWYHTAFNPRWIAISNGIRYLWIISPADLGRTWQQRRFTNKTPWNLATNLYLYATGRGLLSDRLDSLYVPRSDAQPMRTVSAAILKYHGNFNPEPGAWTRMARLARQEAATRVKLSVEPITSLAAATGTVGKADASVNLALMTGTGSFTLSSDETAALKSYLQHGGLLFADAGSSTREFTISFDTLCEKLFPHHPLEPLPFHISLYTGKMPGGVRAMHAEYRKYYIQRHGMHHYAHLDGVKVHGRWVIIFSPCNLTSGLLGTNTWGISGYAPGYAVKLARNLLCYAAGHPADRPAH
ncbi:MAG: DUF4159 domain-containing protein [Phycisphaerae bacterium]